MFLASERNKGLGWKWSGLEMEWNGERKKVDWKWKRDKSEEWEDEWIMIPPTPLELPNCPWLVMTGLNSFYFIYLVYNR